MTSERYSVSYQCCADSFSLNILLNNYQMPCLQCILVFQSTTWLVIFLIHEIKTHRLISNVGIKHSTLEFSMKKNDVVLSFCI